MYRTTSHLLMVAAGCFSTIVLLSNDELAAQAQTSETATKASAERDSIARLIADLDDASFAVRKVATQKLVAAGESAVKPLLEAAEHESLEVAVRAIAILEKNYTHGSAATADSTELALEQLAKSKNRSIASRASSVLEVHFIIRQKRAVTRIQKLGGIFKDLEDNLLNPNDPMALGQTILVLQLGKSWTPGDEGLRFVKRLPRLRSLLFIRGTNKVTEAGLNDLTSALPNLRVVYRGRALLGIRGSAGPRPCQVYHVRPGSAADKANMKQNDIVTSFEGQDVPNFDTLVELIAKKDPGDKVKVGVLRAGKTVVLEVVLDGWDQVRKPAIKKGEQPEKPKKPSE